MEAAFDRKTDEKKETQAPPAALPDESLSLQGELGAPAGMPLFLQRHAEHRGSAAAGDDSEPGPATATAPRRAGHGARLPASLRHTLEPGLGTDLSQVRVHTDPEAAQAARDLNARAFAHGQDIYFADGRFQPNTAAGQRLVAHEVVHTVQQGNGHPAVAASPEISQPGDPLEREAEHLAGKLVHGEQVGPNAVSRHSSADLIARDADARPMMDSRTFYEKYKMQIWDDLLPAFANLHPDTGSLYAYWLSGKNDAFINDTFRPLSLEPWEKLVATAAPADAEVAIRRGRDADKYGMAPDEYRMEVGGEIQALYIPRLLESLARITPQYVAASYLAMKVAPSSTFVEYYQQTAPDAAQLVPANPLDTYVIGGLTGKAGHSQLQVDYQRYESDGLAVKAEGQLVKVRRVNFVWQVEAGALLWIRVVDPVDATPEEVANELYGTPALAGSILAAPPLFGFQPGLLTAANLEQWNTIAAEAHVPTVQLGVGGSGGPAVITLGSYPYHMLLRPNAVFMDPAMDVLWSAAAEQAVMNQARSLPPTGESKEQIIVRLQVCMQLLDEISADAATVGGRQFNDLLVRTMIEDRARVLAASTSPTEAMRWDAHSQAEYQILKAVANAVKTAADQYRAFSVPRKDEGDNDKGDKELPEYVQRPLRSVVDAYVNAAEVAELVETARQRLALAEERSKFYPIDMLEGILAYCRDTIRSATQGLGFEGSHPMRAREESLRAQLYEAREMFALKDPSPLQSAALQSVLKEIQADVSDLQDQVAVAQALDYLDQQWWFLENHWNLIGAFTLKDRKYFEAQSTLQRWQQQFYNIYRGYSSDSPAVREQARSAFAELRKRAPEYAEDVKKIAKTIKTEEARERWITLGLKIVALIGIGLVTAGVGSFISEGLLVGATWSETTAGVIGAAVISSGVEAATFTTLSTVFLEKDPNQSLLATFLENWLLFGSLKFLSVGLDAALGGKHVTFQAGRAGNVAVQIGTSIGASLVKADIESRRRTGTGLSEQQTAEMVGQQVVVFIGTMLAARYGGGKAFLEGMAEAGTETFRGVFGEGLKWVNTARVDALRAAQAATKTPTVELARDALSKDAQALQREIELLKDMEAWATENPVKARLLRIDTAKLAQTRDVNQTVLEARERVSISLELEPEGGNLFRCKPGKLSDILARHTNLGDTFTPTSDAPTKSAIVTTKDGQTFRIREMLPGEDVPPDPVRFKLTSMYMKLPPEAQTVFDDILQRLGPEAALRKFEGMAGSKSGLDVVLTKAGRARAPELPPEAAAREANVVGRMAGPAGVGEEVLSLALRRTWGGIPNPDVGALRAILLASMDPVLARRYQNIDVRVLDEKEWIARFGPNSTEQAVTNFSKNAAGELVAHEVLFRRTGSIFALQEEAAHIGQAADPHWAEAISDVANLNPAEWGGLSLADKLRATRTVLEIERDAQRRLLARAQQQGDTEGADDAFENMEDLAQKIGDVDDKLANPASKRYRSWFEPNRLPSFFASPRVPRTGGAWSGERGNSIWRSTNPDVLAITGRAGIRFRNGYPDFSKWSRAQINLGEMSGYGSDFAEADAAFARGVMNRTREVPDGFTREDFIYRGEPNASATESYRRQAGLTWHHHQGGKLMLFVPTKLHANIPHTGGASAARAAEE